MNYEQYTRTKGETIVPDEVFSRDEFYSPVKHDRRKGRRQDSTPDRLPYWMWRLLTEMVNSRDRSRQPAGIHHYHRRWSPMDKVKLVITTLIAAPIVIIEIGFLLRFLFDR